MEVVTVRCMDGELKVFKNLASLLPSLDNYNFSKEEMLEKIKVLRDTQTKPQTQQQSNLSIMPRSVKRLTSSDISISIQGLSSAIREYYTLNTMKDDVVMVYVRNGHYKEFHYFDKLFAEIASEERRCTFAIYEHNTDIGYRYWYGNIFICKRGENYDVFRIHHPMPLEKISPINHLDALRSEIKNTISLITL